MNAVPAAKPSEPLILNDNANGEWMRNFFLRFFFNLLPFICHLKNYLENFRELVKLKFDSY